MKNYLLGILTVLVIGLMSFNKIDEFVTIKPAKPKEVLCTVVYSEDLKKIVYEYSKKGFIVKTIETRGSSYHCVLLMEKY